MAGKVNLAMDTDKIAKICATICLVQIAFVYWISLTRADPVIFVAIIGLYGALDRNREAAQAYILLSGFTFVLDLLWIGVEGDYLAHKSSSTSGSEHIDDLRRTMVAFASLQMVLKIPFGFAFFLLASSLPNKLSKEGASSVDPLPYKPPSDAGYLASGLSSSYGGAADKYGSGNYGGSGYGAGGAAVPSSFGGASNLSGDQTIRSVLREASNSQAADLAGSYGSGAALGTSYTSSVGATGI